MPNLWSKAGQFISEAISGAKTKDEAIELTFEKMQKTENGVNNIKNLLRTYTTWSDPFCKYIKELSESLKLVYQDTPYQKYIDKIQLKYDLVINEVDNLIKNVAKLYSKTSAWDQIFLQAKELLKIREEKRKNFEHYEQKLQKISKDLKKQKDIELVKRNEEKYKVAASEYFEISEKTFDVMNESMKLSWDLINPTMGDLVVLEKNCLNDISCYLDGYFKIYEEQKKTQAENEYPSNGNSYDPTKYVNSKTLVKKTFSLHETKKDSKNVKTTGKKLVAKRFSAMSGYNTNDDLENKERVLNFYIRNTNSFGKIEEERRVKFLEIKDNEY